MKNIKISKISKLINSGTNHFKIKYSGNCELKCKDFFQVNFNNRKCVFQTININGKYIIARQLTPAIYVWTTYSYQKSNLYKIGLVNWQTVENRLKQTDTTGILEPIQLIEKFDLNTYDPKVTELIEHEIHNRLEMMSDLNTGRSLRARKRREGFYGDWKKTLRPVIIETIRKFCGSKKKMSQFPIQRHYQYSAEISALKHYRNNDRGWIHWTCGTGKSYASFWLIKAILSRIKNPNNTVCFYVPSKQLIVQTSQEIELVASALGFKTNIVRISSEKDHKQEEDITVALNTSNKNVYTIIVSTYQSNYTVIRGLNMSNLSKFDLLIGDEIHKTTGSEGKLFQRAIINTLATKRLYMTASPVFFHDNEYNFSGQENETLYGKCFHRYGFLEAQLDEYITPLEIYGLATSTEDIDEVKSLIEYKRRVIISEDSWDVQQSNFTYYAMLHTTLIALSNRIITHPIIYTNSIRRAGDFMNDLIKMSKQYNVSLNYSNVKVLTGEDSAKSRSDYLNDIFADQDISVVINARCLQEGISASKADSVILIDPRHSAADLVQIIGRPVRLDSTNKNKIAKIFLPLVIEHDKDGRLKFNETMFGTTRDWLTAIISSDSDFQTYFIENPNAIKIEFNDNSRMGISYKEVVDPSAPSMQKLYVSEPKDEDTLASFTISKELIERLKVEAWQKTSSSKVKSSMNTNEVIYKNAYIWINDFLQKKLRDGKMMIQDFNPKMIKRKYAPYYTESVEQIKEQIAAVVSIDFKTIDYIFLKLENIIVDINSTKKELEEMSFNYEIYK